MAELPETVAAYRERFAAGPVGRWDSGWATAPGPSTLWNFDADGTGRFEDRSSMGDRVSWFDWSEVGECVIQFRITREAERDVSGQLTDIDDDDEPMEPATLSYDFKLIDYYGPKVVMFETPEHDTFKFWWTLDYLRRVR